MAELISQSVEPALEYFPLLILGILPSLIWLFYFLEKDNDPEPRMMIVTVFIFGMIGAMVAGSLQPVLRSLLYRLADCPDLNCPEMTLVGLLDSFLIVAFLEELSKLVAVLFGVFHLAKKEIDEPVDLIIYMITAGLGFAALENYLYFNHAPSSILTEVIFLRFAITTLFHALAAGLMGYFLALSVRRLRKDVALAGLVTVSFFHTLYNVLVEMITGDERLIYPSLLLTFLMILTLALMKAFTELKKMKGISLPFANKN